MKSKYFTTCMIALCLVACNSSTPNPDPAEMTEAGDGTSVCPPNEVIHDASIYLDNAPKANKSFDKWHKKNGKRKYVVTTDSGLQYQIIKKGNAAGPSPVGSQIIKANYHGLFLSGEVFDSSYERGVPMEHNANGFIKGWNEALSMMKPCSAWTLYVPGDIAYGPRGRGGIPPNATLIFHMQLLELK